MTNHTTIHPWERAGLGQAPFEWQGVSEEIGPHRWIDAEGIEHIVGAPGQPMGCCAYCSRGIAEVHHIVSADGKRFTVGCNCVRRVYGDDRHDPLLAKVNAAHRRLARKARKAREARKLAEARAFFAEAVHRAALERLPHPNARRAERGETALQSFDWLMANAGTAGRLRALREARKLIGTGLQASGKESRP